MKGERILYVILILIALVTGIYGYISGLFTPHHYYEIDHVDNSCKSPDGIIYINKRENYLVFSHKKDMQRGKFSIIEEKDNYIKWEYVSETYWEVDSKDNTIIYIEQTKLNNYFKVDIWGRVVKDYHQRTFYQTCSITKQFLQRN